MRYHLTDRSANRKTGPIAVTTSPESTCPRTCALKGSGSCYAGFGPLAIHWRHVSADERGETLLRHIAALESLPPGTLVRLNQAGDLPPNHDQARRILRAAATNGKTAWTYTHRKDSATLAMLRRTAKAKTPSAIVNVSADSLRQSDQYIGRGLPVVCITHSTERLQQTPNGTKVVLCPAGGKVTCATCGNGRPLCARPERTYVIAFLAHGSGKGRLPS